MFNISHQTEEARLWGVSFSHELLTGTQMDTIQCSYTDIYPGTQIPTSRLNPTISFASFERKKKYIYRICNGNVLEKAWILTQGRHLVQIHTTGFCVALKRNKKDLDQPTQLMSSEIQQGAEYYKQLNTFKCKKT